VLFVSTKVQALVARLDWIVKERARLRHAAKFVGKTEGLGMGPGMRKLKGDELTFGFMDLTRLS
jgi:hypothetical protein